MIHRVWNQRGGDQTPDRVIVLHLLLQILDLFFGHVFLFVLVRDFRRVKKRKEGFARFRFRDWFLVLRPRFRFLPQHLYGQVLPWFPIDVVAHDVIQHRVFAVVFHVVSLLDRLVGKKRILFEVKSQIKPNHFVAIFVFAFQFPRLHVHQSAQTRLVSLRNLLGQIFDVLHRD